MSFLKSKSVAAMFTLTGTIIGAGILGLPYVFSQSGFLIGLIWLILLGALVIYVSLCLGEVSLRTKEIHQLPGYAEKYLGKFGKDTMLFAVIFGNYSALLAYIIGVGESLSKLFLGNLSFALYFGIGFWAVMSGLLYGGLKRLKQVEYWGVIGIIVIILGVFAIFLPNISFPNLTSMNPSYLFVPFGVILFALLGFMAIPEMRRELSGNGKYMKKSILIGILIPAVLYFIFSLVFVGVLGSKVQDVATISFGGWIGVVLIILGIFTMLTSYFVLDFSLRDILIFDLKKKSWEFFFVAVIPIALYLAVIFFNLANFVEVLGLGGVVSGGLMGILILAINLKAKKNGDRRPEYSVKLNKFILWILSLIFIFGVVAEIFL